jgi:GWxTD domain-containing protein
VHRAKGNGSGCLPAGDTPSHCNPVRRPARIRRAPGAGIASHPFLSLLLVVMTTIAVPARAADRPEAGPPGASRGGLAFFADTSARRNAAGGTVLDVLVEVPYTSLRFSRDAGGWVARFDVTAIVYDRSGNQVNGDLWTIPVRSADANRDQAAGRVLRRRFPLTVGEGRLRVEVTVAQTGTGQEGAWTRTLDVPRWDGAEVAFALPMFGRCDLSPTARDSAWSPPDSAWGASFAPVVRRRFGDSQPDLCVWGAVYDQVPAADPAYRLAWRITGEHDRKGGRGEMTVPRGDHRGVFFLNPPIDSLGHGEWRLAVTATVGGRSATMEERFEIDESRLDVLADAEMIRGVLSYIADNAELVRLEDLPADSLAAFWDAFWLRRDPSAGTERNENRDEFMRRVDYVNGAYSILESGWRSDMGRVYIRYGPPDQVDRVPFSSDGPPHEVWYYTARNLRFVFVDSEGFGRYRLIGRQQP